MGHRSGGHFGSLGADRNSADLCQNGMNAKFHKPAVRDRPASKYGAHRSYGKNVGNAIAGTRFAI